MSTLPLLALLTGLATGELRASKTLNYAAEINKDFMKEYQAEKAARKAAQAEGKEYTPNDPKKAPPEPSEPSSPVISSGGGRLAVLRACGVGIGIGTYRGLQAVQLRRLATRLRTEQAELAEMGAEAVELPAHRGGIRAKIAAHADALRQIEDAKVLAMEVAERKAALLVEVDAAYAQLQLPPPSSVALAQLGVAALQPLLEEVQQRVEACAALLEAYRALGQVPPDDFRAWPLQRAEERLGSLAQLDPLLREALLLQTKLGGARSLETLLEGGEAELQETVAELRAKVEGTQARRDKDMLLGKVEAALWLHKQEVPVGLASSSIEDLQTLLDKLNGVKD